MTDIVCRGCGVVISERSGLHVTEQVFSDGTTHLRGDCPDCGKFVKYIGSGEAKFQIGKYKGQSVPDVAATDPNYCWWAYKSGAAKGRVRRAIEDALGLTKTSAPNFHSAPWKIFDTPEDDLA